MAVEQYPHPQKRPIGYNADGSETLCPFGVQINPNLEEPNAVCPTCGELCTCGCCTNENVAAIGSFTCRACKYYIGPYDGGIICAHPKHL